MVAGLLDWFSRDELNIIHFNGCIDDFSYNMNYFWNKTYSYCLNLTAQLLVLQTFYFIIVYLAFCQ